MKYRIKVVTHHSGKKEFTAYVKRNGIWCGIGWGGWATAFCSYIDDNRENALQRIDRHWKDHSGKSSIEFEYISKP